MTTPSERASSPGPGKRKVRVSWLLGEAVPDTLFGDLQPDLIAFP